MLVSGGTSGIGRAVAEIFIKDGARVFMYGRDENKLIITLNEFQKEKNKVWGIPADQSKIQDIQKVFQQFDRQLGQIDILINNAAVAAGSIMDTSLEDIEYIVKTNLLGYMYCSNLAIERMAKTKSGHIVFIGSMSAEVNDNGASVYVAAKSALRGMVKSLRQEVNHLGIKITLIEPGNVASSMVSENPEEKRNLEKKGMMLSPSDIAQTVYFSLTQSKDTDILTIQLKPRNQIF